MQRLSYIALLFLSLAFPACLDLIEIDLSDAEDDPRLVVEGLIHDGPGPYQVRLFYTAPNGSSIYPPATINFGGISDDQGQFEPLVVRGEGVYEVPGEIIRGEVGRSYKLDFTLFDGTQYSSDWEILSPGGNIDSIYTTISYESRVTPSGVADTRQFLDVFLDSSLPESEEYFIRWEGIHWYQLSEPSQPFNPFFVPKTCYLNQALNPDEVTMLDGRNVDQAEWIGQLVGSARVDFRFAERSVFEIKQYSMSERAFRYWTAVDRVINQSGDFFDSPPAVVRGNVFNEEDRFEEVLGFFGASAIDTLTLNVFRQDLGITINRFCDQPNAQYFFGAGNGDPCTDCSRIPGSLTTRPTFWD